MLIYICIDLEIDSNDFNVFNSALRLDDLLNVYN